ILTAGSLAAQSPSSAYIVTRLGVDTVAIERYIRSNGKLEGDLVLRYPRTRTFHYVADLGSRGEVKSLTTTVQRPGADQAAPPIMQSVARFSDSVAFTSTFFPNWTEVARVDSRGRIEGVNSTATTVKTMAERVPSIDFDNVVKAWAAIDAAKGGAIGQMSPPDTTKATIGAATIQVAYSRPLKRGRVIFGNIVPWNQVWRTGANAATQFTTDRDLVFGGTVVPAGKYTLWTLPTPTGAKLIINSETGQWGTDYHAEKDFARVDLTSNRLSTPVEQFVIGLAPQGSGGVLRLAWDDREYLIPFTVK
ncbi:MAG TPA: DUF2911 domain-containing protein, partial [Gemmatimonadaceae bacterium]|nr:DUF2911 domain-containing protein [Gemmatimonadaceae bacterium]